MRISGAIPNAATPSGHWGTLEALLQCFPWDGRAGGHVLPPGTIPARSDFASLLKQCWLTSFLRGRAQRAVLPHPWRFSRPGWTGPGQPELAWGNQPTARVGAGRALRTLPTQPILRFYTDSNPAPISPAGWKPLRGKGTARSCRKMSSPPGSKAARLAPISPDALLGREEQRSPAAAPGPGKGGEKKKRTSFHRKRKTGELRPSCSSTRIANPGGRAEKGEKFSSRPIYLFLPTRRVSLLHTT